MTYKLKVVGLHLDSKQNGKVAVTLEGSFGWKEHGSLTVLVNADDCPELGETVTLSLG